MMAAVGRRVRLVARAVIRAVRKAHDEQVYTFECLLLTSRAAPVTTTGGLRWVPSLGGYRLAGSYLPAGDRRDPGALSAAGRSARCWVTAAASWAREVMSSLANTWAR